jgi:hypothetical protein
MPVASESPQTVPRTVLLACKGWEAERAHARRVPA